MSMQSAEYFVIGVVLIHTTHYSVDIHTVHKPAQEYSIHLNLAPIIIIIIINLGQQDVDNEDKHCTSYNRNIKNI
jgi:hypothetical protein